MTTNPANPLPETTPAWWVHWLNIALATAAFIAGAIHPGYTLPTAVASGVGVASVALAAISSAVIVLHAHGLRLATLRSLGGSLHPALDGLAEDLDQLGRAVPALAGRVDAIEGGLRLLGLGASALAGSPATGPQKASGPPGDADAALAAARGATSPAGASAGTEG